MNWLLLWLLSGLFAPPPSAHADSISLEQLRAQVVTLQTEFFPHWNSATIELKPLDWDETDFFQANFPKRDLFASPHSRRYRIRYHPQVLMDPPPEDALQAILLHELHHINDYRAWRTGQMIGFVWHYLTRTVFRSTYERQTDLQVLQLKKGPGLIEYRNWLYRRLPTKTIEEKRRDYWTPEEISEWLKRNTSSANVTAEEELTFLAL